MKHDQLQGDTCCRSTVSKLPHQYIVRAPCLPCLAVLKGVVAEGEAAESIYIAPAFQASVMITETSQASDARHLFCRMRSTMPVKLLGLARAL